jgi:hypothetical protein
MYGFFYISDESPGGRTLYSKELSSFKLRPSCVCVVAHKFTPAINSHLLACVHPLSVMNSPLCAFVSFVPISFASFASWSSTPSPPMPIAFHWWFHPCVWWIHPCERLSHLCQSHFHHLLLYQISSRHPCQSHLTGEFTPACMNSAPACMNPAPACDEFTPYVWCFIVGRTRVIIHNTS